jgi:hypothetical protein
MRAAMVARTPWWRGGVVGALVEGSVVALDLAVGLRVVDVGPDVGEAGEVDEAAEVAGDELRAVVGDDSRAGAGRRRRSCGRSGAAVAEVSAAFKQHV